MLSEAKSRERSESGNGRVYDALIGSFLSPDKYVQNAGFTQNFNRYSYCLNNPLKYIDPSGYVALKTWDDFWNVVDNLWNSGGGGWDSNNGNSTGVEGGGNDYGHISVNISIPVGGGFVTVTVPYLNSLPDVKVVAYKTEPLIKNFNNARDNSDYTFHDTFTFPLTPYIDYKTTLTTGSGPIHIKTKNGDNGAIINIIKSGPLSIETNLTGKFESTITFTIGHNFLLMSNKVNSVSFGFGFVNQNFKSGYSIEIPKLLLLPILMETPNPGYVPCKVEY